MKRTETSGNADCMASGKLQKFEFNMTWLAECAGFYYFVLPVYMWLKNLVWPKNLGGF